jgi:hypothetical protein
MDKITIGSEVVRSKGDYVVGRVGIVIEIDAEKNRAKVEWNNAANDWALPKTWVKMEAIEPTSIPYEILPPRPTCQRTGKSYWQTYNRIA